MPSLLLHPTGGRSSLHPGFKEARWDPKLTPDPEMAQGMARGAFYAHYMGPPIHPAPDNGPTLLLHRGS